MAVNNSNQNPQSVTAIETIKSWFKTGLKPTQSQFWAWMDSYWHKDESIPMDKISNLTPAINGKLEAEEFKKHLEDDDAHKDLFDTKVDKVDGKGLSTNDYTNEDKSKLNSLQTAESLQTFKSLLEATETIGVGKFFLFSEDNTDGVVSPNGSVVGVTKDK